MQLSRRRFLECAAGVAGGAVAMALPRELAALERVEQVDRQVRASAAVAHCVLLDLGEDCTLRESLAGYESALATLGAPAILADARWIPRSALLIVPAAMRISPSIARQLMARAQRGSTVILESGAAFSAEGDADFVAHRDVLRDELQVHIDSPLPLWPRPAAHGGIPYVSYHWPSVASVRDFSRVVPLGMLPAQAEVIARAGGLPVALRRRVGSGTLVFLGSPLGPTLRAGDADARRWLGEVMTAG